MSKGTINVQTENIFPIIKKFLYSDHEIFLRELIANATDATKKIQALASMGETKEKVGDTTIEILLDKKKKTITISDKGLGMNKEDVEKYINQIAFSGATEFVEKFKDKADASSIIGKFGLGFYSAFMVAEKVVIKTRKYDDKKGVKWSCTGSPEYELIDCDKKERGTDIILHIAEDSTEFLEDARINTLLDKYCKFMPVAIKFGTKKEFIDNKKGEKDKDGKVKQDEITVDNIVNNTSPVWVKTPAKLKTEDYKSFYRELYPMVFEEPLFHIHLNVDYPFNLTGVLYFPKLKPNIEIQKNKIQLYSRQVFITDSVEGVVPEFLMLLQGVLDSPDIPLNVSRSYLQSDSNVKKISNHISKKVADKLEEMFKEDRKNFESKWKDIKLFIDYGMLSDEKFYERIEKVALYETVDGEFLTMEELTKKIKPNQTDKDKKLIHLYTNNPEEQHYYIDLAKQKNYEVIVLDTPLTGHLVGKLEQSLKDTTFARIDADSIDKLINKDEKIPAKLSDKEQESLKEIIASIAPKEKYTVQLESQNESEQAMTIVQPEFMRRMKDMNAIGGGGMAMLGNMPESYTLVININHPLSTKILKEKTEKKKKDLTKQAFDLALLSQNLLKGKELTAFVKRSYSLI